MKNLYKIENELYIVDDTEEINKDTKTCWCIDISCNELVLHQGVLPSYHYKHYKKIIMTTDKSINVLCSCGKDCGAKESGVQAIDDEFLEWFVKNPSCEYVEMDTNWEFLGDDYRRGGEQTLVYKIIIPKEEPKQDLEKEMFELEQELDIPSHLRWHNSKPKQETLEEAAEKLYLSHENNELLYGHSEDLKLAYKAGILDGAKWQAEKLSKDELLKEITRLQEKYDENGYDCSPLIKLQRIEQHVDAAFEIYSSEIDKMYSEEDMKESFIKGALTDLWNTWNISDEDMAKEKFIEWFEQFKKK